MHHIYLQYLRSPSRDTWLELRHATIHAHDFDPSARYLDTLDQMMEDDLWDEVRVHLDKATPSYLASPRFHLQAARVHREWEEDAQAEQELEIAVKLANGMLASGNGSPSAPYLVTRNSDGADLCMRLGKEPLGYEPKRRADRLMEVFTTDDGGELWIDLTEAYQRTARVF